MRFERTRTALFIGIVCALVVSAIAGRGEGLYVPAPSWTYSVTSLGTGVATALGINVGSAGAPVTFNGAGGTPSSLTGTNISGTAASLTAGNVTTNANLTGAVTSVGNATTMNSASTALSDVTAATTWTPTDASGAALSFTTVTGNYSKINKTCTGSFRLTYPSTASGAVANINLPAACVFANNGNHAVGSCWSTATTPNGTLVLLAQANTATASFINLTGGASQPTNLNLSTIVLTCGFSFITT